MTLNNVNMGKFDAQEELVLRQTIAHHAGVRLESVVITSTSGE